MLRVFALLLSLLTLLFIQPAAHAHVSLISTSPQYDSTVDQLPLLVAIEFNEPLIVLGEKNPNSIQVIAPSGITATEGEVQVEGAKISVALDQAIFEPGVYTVRYRVVSSDGHGVSGSYRFTVAGEAVAIAVPIAAVTPSDAHDFWHVHRAHVIEGVLALLAIGAWALYRARFAHRK
jgi:methionine-rich copper-binding protein CopC